MRTGCWALLGAALLAGAPSPANAQELARLRLCNPEGGVRAERTSRGVRVRYTNREGRPAGPDFTLRGWEPAAAWPQGGGGCVELARPGPEAREALRAWDEVFETGGAFQEKAVLRRTQRVIELGGERIVIEGTEVVKPETEKKTK